LRPWKTGSQQNYIVLTAAKNVFMMGLNRIDRQDRRVELPGSKRRIAKKTIIANNNYNLAA